MATGSKAVSDATWHNLGVVTGSLFAVILAVAFHQHHSSTVDQLKSLLHESRDRAGDVDAALRGIQALLTNPSGKASNTQGQVHLNQRCILAVDHGSINASLLADTSSPDYLEDNAKHLPSWLSSQLINQLYAERHGYTFYSLDAITPALIGEGIDPSSINRIAFINRQLACCCRWVLALLDGAYIRMEQHSLPVEQWAATLGERDTFAWITRSGIDMDNQTWFPSDPAALVGEKDSQQQGEGGRISGRRSRGRRERKVCGGSRVVQGSRRMRGGGRGRGRGGG
ncbi:hypothetical protein CLOM_g19324 [Closterium sp. NIES-68]|nr:hypothetical protein CLOM_g19324 [Closterium sp. NIES-68]